jgi:arginyl-tRNA synthetase
MLIGEKLRRELELIVRDLGGDFLPVVEMPTDLRHGDFTSNAAMVLGKRLKRNPLELAEEISERFLDKKNSVVERVEAVRPGFVNFWLSEEYLVSEVDRLIHMERVEVDSSLKGKRVLIEYGHPNTHKEMHIGHMRTLITGEAMARIFAAAGAKVFRANYQGDIGPHVAKALYGVQKMLEEKGLVLGDVAGWTDRDKAHFLGEAYVRGNKDYDVEKDRIDGVNKQLYGLMELDSRLRGNDKKIGGNDKGERGESVGELYRETRQWSLDYYDDFYARFYTKFDRLFFESEMVEDGRRIVLENGAQVFEEDNGAVVFKGEKYGLHTRVFITQGGYPTYEGKEMACAYGEYEAFPFDIKMHVVANEQAGYFKVVFKALELLDKEKFGDKQYHVSMGMVQLSDRKMSSRTGDVLTVDWLIDEVRSRVNDIVTGQKVSDKEMSVEEAGVIGEQVTIGAIKYSVLKVGTGVTAAFDIEKSVSLTGNSGPYLQYTYARTQSVLRRAGKNELRIMNQESRIKNDGMRKMGEENKDAVMRSEELELLRLLVRFEDVVRGAAERYSPNVVANYLFEVAQVFNLFYQKLPILKPSSSEGKEDEGVRGFRLGLTAAVGNVMRLGLDLLGIKAPDRM